MGRILACHAPPRPRTRSRKPADHPPAPHRPPPTLIDPVPEVTLSMSTKTQWERFFRNKSHRSKCAPKGCAPGMARNSGGPRPDPPGADRVSFSCPAGSQARDGLRPRASRFTSRLKSRAVRDRDAALQATSAPTDTSKRCAISTLYVLFHGRLQASRRLRTEPDGSTPCRSAQLAVRRHTQPTAEPPPSPVLASSESLPPSALRAVSNRRSRRHPDEMTTIEATHAPTFSRRAGGMRQMT